ncbi:MAG: PEP-CTERM sorting domain-containing protein [Verrucomicrobiae bacterium]|nr:PEP-CTERM sorting domain-containing protein [Verrucomicrobiae bacterium]
MVALGLAAPHSAKAVVIFSENFDSTPVYGIPAGWSATDDSGGFLNPPSVYDVSGNHVLHFDSMAGNPRASSTTINFTNYLNWEITLSFDLRYAQDSLAPPDTALIVGLTEPSMRPFGVSTWVGGNGVGAPSGNEIYAPFDTWTNITLDLTSSLIAHPATDGIFMKIWSDRGDYGAVADLDNIQITAVAVPEPSAGLLILGAGLAAVALRRSRP